MPVTCRTKNADLLAGEEVAEAEAEAKEPDRSKRARNKTKIFLAITFILGLKNSKKEKEAQK